MRALLRNLLAGFRLATFQRVDADRFRVSIGQWVGLLIIEFVLGVAVARAFVDGDAYFNRGYVMDSLASITITLALAALLARWTRAPGILLGFAVATAALSPMLLVYGYASRLAWQHLSLGPVAAWAWMVGWVVLLALLLTRAASLWALLRLRTRTAIAAFFVVVVATELWLIPHDDAWYAVPAEQTPLEVGRHETLLYQQPALLAAQLTALRPERSDRDDLYFVGFAGYGAQDVFMKEVNHVRSQFDARFDTAGRSMVLINNAQADATAPIATLTALQSTLDRVGGLLDPENDVLFLFVTSHGAADPAYLSVTHTGLELTQLTPERLKAALAATPIKWKVIVVSACYSGGFIPALRDEHSLVITASRADRNSFGCDDRNDMTDFGKAYFSEALQQTRSFTAAYDLARARIAAREAAEGLTPSQPQMAMGARFAERWRGVYN